MKTVKFRSESTINSSPKYRGVPDEDAQRILDAHSKGNYGPVRFRSWTMEVSIKPASFVAIEVR